MKEMKPIDELSLQQTIMTEVEKEMAPHPLLYKIAAIFITVFIASAAIYFKVNAMTLSILLIAWLITEFIIFIKMKKNINRGKYKIVECTEGIFKDKRVQEEEIRESEDDVYYEHHYMVSLRINKAIQTFETTAKVYNKVNGGSHRVVYVVTTENLKNKRQEQILVVI